MRLSVVGALLLALGLFGLGYWLGNRGPDVSPQVDSLIVRSVRTDTLIQTVVKREVVVRATVESLTARVDTLTLTVREALPDSLRPILDSLRGAQDAALALLRGQSDAWREVADSLKAERDAGLALLRQRTRKPFPLAIVAGVAVTPHGLMPALSVGIRIPLPHLF
jgi:hypothetical protein